MRLTEASRPTQATFSVAFAQGLGLLWARCGQSPPPADQPGSGQWNWMLQRRLSLLGAPSPDQAVRDGHRIIGLARLPAAAVGSARGAVSADRGFGTRMCPLPRCRIA